MANLDGLSFMDGFLMARTVLGDSRQAALASWDARLGEMFTGLKDEYARRKLGFATEIAYTEDFVKTMPELDSWFAGMAFVFLSDEAYQRRLEALEDTEVGKMGWHFQAIFQSFMVAGPIARGRPPRPEDQLLLPDLKRALEKFRSELRRYGLRKRLDYVGSILGLLQGVAQAPLPEQPSG
ncbi:hypothetical protein QR90_14490 [Deinococcus radiopugnans]|uniref:Uncharacterized protein n=1 Tax=Deinococcus radiopugnans TaxID=57497 RepID=A0A0A7KIP6_9DEIO|nr:hypothetical protein [Deinococcus radiopugnans]AIZ46016.1 hypothetical protein QR90_14490 [Deinococcus radiopugnans]QLG11877.1 hypothetical protein HLB42_14625 [Deinococcus sp. D7000]